MSGFRFASADDGDLFKSLSSLYKYNSGLFKSEKQAAFLLKRVFGNQKTDESVAEDKRFFGIDTKVGQRSFSVDGYMQWAEYGTRGMIPVTWIFVADHAGLVAVYKLGYNGNMREGAYPNPTKTKTLWVRPADVVVPEPAAPAPIVEDTSSFVGTPGKRMTMVGTVLSVRQFESSSRFGYYDNGLRTQTIVDVNGSKVVYWNALGDAEAGDVVEFTATVKTHEVYKNRNQTVVSRASKVVVKKAEEKV